MLKGASILRKQNLTNLLIFSFIFVITTLPIQAQFQSPLKAYIPFSFEVGEQTLPAGEYSFTPATKSGLRSALLIKSADGKNSVIVTPGLTQSKEVIIRGKLVFNISEKHYTLAFIWLPATDYGRKLLSAKAEERLAKGDVQPKTVTIVCE